jgi:hypothetical protein
MNRMIDVVVDVTTHNHADATTLMIAEETLTIYDITTLGNLHEITHLHLITFS